MNDEDFEHALTNGTPTELAQHVDLARRKAQTAMAIFGAVAALVVLVAITSLAFVVRDKVQERNDNTKSLIALQVELKSAKDLLAKNDEATADRDKCQTILQAAVYSSDRDFQAAMGSLIILIATTIPEDRAVAIGDGVQTLQDSLTVYKEAATRLTAWQTLAADQQIPCPIP